MTYNLACNSLSRNCTSRCCNLFGSCATTSSSCVFQYADYNSGYWNGSVLNNTINNLYNVNCLSSARSCSSRCCTSSGFCAYSESTCVYQYGDYYRSYWDISVAVKATAGPIAGGVVGGVIGLIIIIALIIWWKKKQAADALAISQMNNTNNDNGGTTIIMTNPTPQQPAYGMPQPMMQQPMMNPYQPGYMQPQPMYGQPQPGPIIISSWVNLKTENLSFEFIFLNIYFEWMNNQTKSN